MVFFCQSGHIADILSPNSLLMGHAMHRTQYCYALEGPDKDALAVWEWIRHIKKNKKHSSGLLGGKKNCP